ncbi:MAG TPA: hypothetical protein VER03_12825 [Bryobacteraceae bacterium]|nr:hypothetical protein [Bryobacteraceae bacterium]
MKQELRAMLNTDTVVYDFIVPQQAKPPAYFQTLISVRMTGACDVRSRTPSPASGPLAFAHSADGKIIPFIEVQCDRVRGHVRPAFWGPDMDRSEYLYGRALARVLAHELYHVLTGRKAHTTLGITRKSLTGSQLISDHVEFESATLHSTSNGLH